MNLHCVLLTPSVNQNPLQKVCQYPFQKCQFLWLPIQEQPCQSPPFHFHKLPWIFVYSAMNLTYRGLLNIWLLIMTNVLCCVLFAGPLKHLCCKSRSDYSSRNIIPKNVIIGAVTVQFDNHSLIWFDSLHPINNLSVMWGQVFLGWTSTKLGLFCLAQGHNPVTLVRLEPAAPQSWVKHSTTALPNHSLRDDIFHYYPLWDCDIYFIMRNIISIYFTFIPLSMLWEVPREFTASLLIIIYRHEWSNKIMLQLIYRHEWSIIIMLQLTYRHEWSYKIMLQLIYRHEWSYIIMLQLIYRHEWSYIIMLQLIYRHE